MLLKNKFTLMVFTIPVALALPAHIGPLVGDAAGQACATVCILDPARNCINDEGQTLYGYCAAGEDPFCTM